LLLAFWGVRFCLLLVPEEIKWIVPGGKETIGVDLSVCGFTFLISLLTGMAFGLMPAVKASKANLNEALKEGKRSAADHSARGGEGGLLVVFEIAVSLVLLIGASLMAKSFWRLIRIEVGFNPDRVVTMLLLSPYDSAFYAQLIQRVKALPGVEAASLMDNVPAGEFWLSGDEFTIEGRPINRPLVPRAISAVIDPDFLKTMEIPLLRGRAFTDHDTKEFPGVALISQSLARRYFPGEDPIGKRLRPGEPGAKTPWLSVVGVVADVQHKLNPEPIPTLYGSYLQQGPIGGMYLFVRTMSPAANAVDAIRKEVWRIDRNQPITYFWTMDHVVSASIFVSRFIAWLLGCYAALSLLFALMGIFGVVSYGVSRKTHEIGVRMALGAQRSDVLTMFLRRSLFLALIGVGLGVTAALATTRLLRSQLHGISSTDPWTFVEVPFVLVAVALLAIYIPALRATKVDPMVALRHE
jgi:putative ABC transport system permease protein